MKTTATRLFIFKFLMVFAFYSNAQTISDYENLTLPVDSFWNGKDQSGEFTSGNALFVNSYDVTWDYWSGGFAYSNMKDSVTAGSSNLYSARTADGYNNSDNYAIGKEGAVIKLENSAISGVVNGFYVTNSTYAGLSMRDGDSFAKKFGGTTGDDPDWFKLSITGFYNNAPLSDTVEFYLADYRFSDNTQDYIVTTWEWVDLQSLGNLDSLIFHLSSSDVGSWGMNTPGFFCVDNFTTADSPVLVENIKTLNNSISVYPNPADHQINVSFNDYKKSSAIRIIDLTGREVYKENIKNIQKHTIDLPGLPSGAYIIEISFGANSVERNIFIKK